MDGQVEFGAKINKTQIEKDAKGIKNTLRNTLTTCFFQQVIKP